MSGDHRGDEPPPWFVMLREQKRMRPEISRVVNRFIYSGRLRDGSLATLDEPSKKACHATAASPPTPTTADSPAPSTTSR